MTEMDRSPAVTELGAARDRLIRIGSLISFLAVLLAIWVRAPSLRIELPLMGGAKAELNVGYVLAMGCPVLAFAQVWTLGLVLRVRGFQLSFLADLHQFKDLAESVSRAELIQCLGYWVGIGMKVSKLDIGTHALLRMFWLFGIPLICQMMIIIKFFDLVPKEYFFDPNLHPNEFNGSLLLYDFSLDDKFYLPDSTIESSSDDVKEVWSNHYKEFPRFYIPFNSYINIVCFLISLFTAVLSSKYYFSKEIFNQIRKYFKD